MRLALNVFSEEEAAARCAGVISDLHNLVFP
jgi:hypothetical protein